MRVLLAGASGLIGTALAAHLAAAGDEVVRLVRRPPRGRDEVRWDPEAGEIEAAALAGVEAAVHLGGRNIAGGRWTRKFKEELRRSRVESTRLLARALAALERPPQVLVCASAVGIYGDRGSEILDEDSAAGTGFLAELGRDWEAAAASAGAKMRVAHARFGIVLSRSGGALARMLPPFRLGLGGRLGRGRQYMSWIELGDAAGALAWILRHQQLSGPVNVVAPHPVRNAEFTRALARALGRPALLPAPAFALRLVLGELADEGLLASQRAVPGKLLQSGFSFACPHLEAALAKALAG